MRLSPLARWECLSLAGSGLLLAGACFILGWWWLLPIVAIAAAALVLFFRDPNRRPPAQRNAWVAVADGRVSSVHEIESYEPLGGEPVLCVRIFISVLDVHVVRSPAHARLAASVDRGGTFRNALRAENLEDNASRTLTLHHPVRDEAIGAVRLIAGALARTITTPVKPGTTLQRGSPASWYPMAISDRAHARRRSSSQEQRSWPWA